MYLEEKLKPEIVNEYLAKKYPASCRLEMAKEVVRSRSSWCRASRWP
jgi:hypothetical protein